MANLRSSAAFYAGITCAALSVPASAQDAGGLQADVTLSTGLTYSDKSGTSGRTDLGFDLTSTTRSQTFALSLNSTVLLDLRGETSLQAENPRFGLSYGVESRQTAFTSDLFFRQSDVDAFTDELTAIVFDEGSRETFGADIGYEFGREAPFGGTISLGYTDLSYIGELSPELIDTATTQAGINLRFDVDQRITATLGYERSDADRAIGRDIENESLTVGAALAVTPTLDADVTLGVTQVTSSNGPSQNTSDGVTYALNLTKERPLGEWRVSLDSRLGENGRRTTALFGGTFELPRAQINAEIGLTERTNDTARPLLTLGYTEDLPRGNYSITLDQGFATDAEGVESLNSRLRLAWRQDLTRTGQLTSDLTYQTTDYLGVSDDTSRLVLGLQYDQDLNDDWTLTTSYTHSVSSGDATPTRRENEIFVGLETNYGWRP